MGKTRRSRSELPGRTGKTMAYYALCMDKKLSSAAKAVGACLVDHFNRRTGQCDPGVNRIADKTELHRASVFRALKELEKYGYVVRDQYGGNSHRNSYQIVWGRMCNVVERSKPSQERDGNGRKAATHDGRGNATQTFEGTIEDKPLKQGLAGDRSGNSSNQRHFLLPLSFGKKGQPSHRTVQRERAAHRWERDLRQVLGEQYPNAVEMITGKLADQATEHEMRQSGRGHELILSAMSAAVAMPIACNG